MWAVTNGDNGLIFAVAGMPESFTNWVFQIHGPFERESVAIARDYYGLTVVTYELG
jgi:hypothetical protein